MYQVFGERRKGGFAEYAAVPTRNLVELPDRVPITTAAAAPMVTDTAWRALLIRAELEPYEEVLTVGAAGVSHMAVQIDVLQGGVELVAEQ